MSRSTATPQPSIIIPVWPVGTNDGRSAGGLAPPRRSSSATDILPIAQSVPTVRITRLPGPWRPPDGGLHPVRRPAVVDDPRPGRGGRRGELRVVAEERVEAGVDVEAGLDRLEDRRPPRGRQLAAGRRDADEQRVRARLGRASASASDRDDRDVVVRQDRRDVAAGLGRVDDRDDVVGSVADHADGGLAVVEAEVALGEDDEAARADGRGDVHPTESTETVAVTKRVAGGRAGARMVSGRPGDSAGGCPAGRIPRTDAPVPGLPRAAYPHKYFKFRVKWDGRYVAEISRLSGLRRTTEVIEHREGGDPSTSHKSPGLTHYEAITLERGVTHDVEFEQWANMLGRPPSGAAGDVSLAHFRKDLIIQLINEAGMVVKAFKVYRCWPSEYQALPDLEANGNAVAIETLKLENEGWERDEAVGNPTSRRHSGSSLRGSSD